MAKRANGEGSIFYSEAKKCWAGYLRIERGGRSNKTWRYGKKQEQVKKALDALKADASAGRLTQPGKVRVSEFLTWWLDNVAQPNYRFGSTRFYRGLINKKIIPQVGGLQLKNLEPRDVDELVSGLQASGESPRMRQQVYDCLKKALGVAVKRDFVHRNVCERVARPKVPKPEMEVLNEAQADAILRAAATNRYSALFVLVLNTGLRFGETAGLKWKDLDLDGRRLSVRRAVVAGQEADNEGKLRERPVSAEPKSRKGRHIILPMEAIRAMWAHRSRMEDESHLELVFCDRKGGALRGSNFCRRVFRPLIEKANKLLEKEHREKIPARFRFHDLRHTHATWLLADGVHPKIVSERLGHATVAITLDLYSHVLPSMQQQAVDAMNKRYSRREREQIA